MLLFIPVCVTIYTHTQGKNMISIKLIAETIKKTVRSTYLLQAEAKTLWIMKLKLIRVSELYRACTDESQRIELLNQKGYGKGHIQLSRCSEHCIRETMIKDAERSLGRINVAVRKEFAGEDVGSVELLRTTHRQDPSIDGEWRVFLKDGSHRYFSFHTFMVGGHKNQCSHLRTKYTLV
jgi:hypothetical protein